MPYLLFDQLPFTFQYDFLYSSDIIQLVWTVFNNDNNRMQKNVEQFK